MNPPAWASELVERLAPKYSLTWRRSKRQWQSSGHCNRKQHRLVVTAGESRVDQFVVLLHEIAHARSPKGHTFRFWEEAWTLYVMEGAPITYALAREHHYRQKAILVANALGLPTLENDEADKILAAWWDKEKELSK